MSEEVEEAIEKLKKFIEISRSITEEILQGEDKEIREGVEIDKIRCDAEEVLINYIKKLETNYETLIHDISLIAESLGLEEDATIDEIAQVISDSTPNSVIREKIKELNTKSGGNVFHIQQTINAEISLLEEILEGEKE